MAAAEAKSSDSLQDDLKCPVCLGIFADAIMLPTCGHTFCRRCLSEYVQSYRPLGCMDCPVCRKITKFTPAKGVDDFPANVTVNRIVDNYRQDHGCKTETRPKCTACRRQGDAESFCKTCNKYLCERCLTSHQEMSAMFEGHEIVPIEETKGLKGKNRLKLGDPRIGLRSGTLSSSPKLEVIRSVDLPGQMKVMTKYYCDSVAIGYKYSSNGDISGVHTIDSDGSQSRRQILPPNMWFESIMFQEDSSFCISDGNGVHFYSRYGEKKSVEGGMCSLGTGLRLSRGLSGEIIMTNALKRFYIYNSTGSTCKHNISTKHIVSQASVTSSGLIVTSSCNAMTRNMQGFTDASMVTVYDRDGNAGESLQAPDDVYLYAAVDEQDRVYVASVDCKNNNMVIRLYDIVGLNLKKRVGFNAPNFRCAWSDWCYLVYLSRDMLAFASSGILYFIGGNLSRKKVNLIKV
ncbi:uncharacterized protein LOC135155506 isoform X2 [Lytechinus pictus]|uniref:uncharacterized protein LOC135155506 isoform X2 n=1 Tax=Lytechinus pictus TaxID=7653 RepID=UPI0030B9AE05